MDRSDVLTLISIEYTVDDIGQQIPVETRRDVFCQVSSVTANEFFAAGKEGMHPEYRCTMFRPDYDGETLAELNGKQFNVYRTYIGKNDTIELYMERNVGT